MAIHVAVHRGRGDWYRTVTGTLLLEGPFSVGDEVEFEVDHSALTVEGDTDTLALFNGPTEIAVTSAPGFLVFMNLDGTTGEAWRGLCRYVGDEIVIGVGTEYPAPGDDVTLTWSRRGCLL